MVPADASTGYPPRVKSLQEYEDAGRDRLDAMTRAYYASGARDQHTLRWNREAWSRLALRPRVLAGVMHRDMSTTVLGAPVDVPVLVAPMAFQGLAHADAEAATARAAAQLGSLMVLSTFSNTAVEDVVRSAEGRCWFQLYVYRDRGLTRAVVDRARDAGCRALVLTVDAPVLGVREDDEHHCFGLPDHLSLPNVLGHRVPSVDGASGLTAYVAEQLDPGLDWRDVEWLRDVSGLPVVVKGVLRGDDTRLAVDHGASAIIVSNHGGRQLDTALPTIEALPEVVQAARGDIEVYLDGGVRRGTDVLKALALGARAVLLGRPVLWGLAVDGDAGVAHVLRLLRDELDEAMALSGCRDLASVTRDLVVRR